MTGHNIDSPELSDIWFRSLAYPIQARLEMIRTHYLTQINDMIRNEKRFKEADFTVSFKPERSTYLLEITYCYEPQYKFVAAMALDEEPVTEIYMTIIASPGSVFKKERYDQIHSSKLSDHIKAWLSRLSNELASIPVQRQIEEQRQEIQQILTQLDDLPNEYFSKQEADVLRSRLDALEASLTDNLKETATNQRELQIKVKAITDDVNGLKENINVLNKRGWAKSLVTRTFEWAKDPANSNLLKSGVEVAKRLLEAGDHHVK